MDLIPVYPPLKSDLHSHTACSDGKLSPVEYIDYAVAREIRVLALTDHDNMNALEPVLKYVKDKDLPIRIIPGIELSTTWMEGTCPYQIHIVGLNCDPSNARLQEIIRINKEKRDYRVEVISAKLVKNGVDAKDLADYLSVYQQAGTFITRKHFADYLIKNHIVPDNSAAFDKYLTKGGLAYCKVEWGSIPEAVKVIKDAGGVPVLAHPMRYKELNKKTKYRDRLVDYYTEQGGVAIETAHPMMKSEEKKVARDYASSHGLYSSYGSDFHERNVPERAMGRDLWLAAPSKPIWEHDQIKDYFKQ